VLALFRRGGSVPKFRTILFRAVRCRTAPIVIIRLHASGVGTVNLRKHRGTSMKRTTAFVVSALAAASVAKAEELKLPPEVTPALRAACEGDVRRLGCIDATPTYAKVKSCVISKYMKLGKKCQLELAMAGYSGPANMPKSSTKTAAVKSASE
jgi:hypothetical protein